MILDRPERFTPDKPLNDTDIAALIDICGETLNPTSMILYNPETEASLLLQ